MTQEKQLQLYSESVQNDLNFLELEKLQVKDEIEMLKRKLENISKRKEICKQQILKAKQMK